MGQDFAQGPPVTGPGLSPPSPRPLPWPRPHREPGAQLSVPVLRCPGRWGPASPLTLSSQTGLSSCPPQGGKPPAPPQTPQENQNPNTCVAASRLYSWVEGKDRSQKWVTVVPWMAGGISSAQASPAISGCFCRRCLSRVARRPKGTQQWGHSKRGPPGPRPCMRRWRLSLLLWAQA